MQTKRIANPKTIVKAIQSGTASAIDGAWIGACRTTRIYCRPQCPAGKHVHEGNIVAFSSAAEAEKAGYRPCLTCCPEAAALPTESHGISKEAADFAETISKAFTSGSVIKDFCANRGISEAELEETVQNAFGTTSREYIDTARRLTAKKMLRESTTTVEEVAKQCGYPTADDLRAEFKTRYKFDADKLAAQHPRKPRLAK